MDLRVPENGAGKKQYERTAPVDLWFRKGCPMHSGAGESEAGEADGGVSNLSSHTCPGWSKGRVKSGENHLPSHLVQDEHNQGRL